MTLCRFSELFVAVDSISQNWIEFICQRIGISKWRGQWLVPNGPCPEFRMRLNQNSSQKRCFSVVRARNASLLIAFLPLFTLYCAASIKCCKVAVWLFGRTDGLTGDGQTATATAITIIICYFFLYANAFVHLMCLLCLFCEWPLSFTLMASFCHLWSVHAFFFTPASLSRRHGYESSVRQVEFSMWCQLNEMCPIECVALILSFFRFLVSYFCAVVHSSIHSLRQLRSIVTTCRRTFSFWDERSLTRRT